MALITNKMLDNGLNLQGVYARIDSISGYKGKIDISLNYYTTREHFLQGKGYIHQELLHFVPDVGKHSENFIRQGYVYLKTLPEHMRAEDVWEDGQN